MISYVYIYIYIHTYTPNVLEDQLEDMFHLRFRLKCCGVGLYRREATIMACSEKQDASASGKSIK